MHQLLRVGVRDNEIHAVQIRGDHVIHSIGTTPANADHSDSWGEVGVHLLRRIEVQGHSEVLPRGRSKSL